METSEYIQNRINTNIRHYEELSKKYHRCHVGLLISVISCFICVIVLNVIYLIAINLFTFLLFIFIGKRTYLKQLLKINFYY